MVLAGEETQAAKSKPRAISINLGVPFLMMRDSWNQRWARGSGRAWQGGL